MSGYTKLLGKKENRADLYLCAGRVLEYVPDDKVFIHFSVVTYCNLAGSEFELQASYYVHFLTKSI